VSPAGTVSWVAWRVTRAGEVETLVTRGTSAGAERRQERFGTLGTAEARFGSGFGEVVRRALAGGSRAGRWRP
jgi:hypothetical protein